MRDLVFALLMAGLLPLALVRPFVGVLVWCWISFMNPHLLLWGFSSSQPWAMLTFCATVAGCVLAGEPRRPAVNGVTVMLFLFFLGITMTSTTALGIPEFVWDKWEWATKILLGLLVTGALLTDRRRVHALIWLMVIALGYFGVKGGLFTLMTGGSYIVLGPPGGPIADRNHLAAALLISLPLMNYLRMHSRHRGVRNGLIAAMVLTLFAVVGSQSRGALLGLTATALFLWVRSPKKLLSGTVMVIGLALALYFMPASWWERMNTIESYEEDASAMGRIQIWMAALQIALAHPLTGGGFMSMYFQFVVDIYAPGTTGRASHSIWFEVIGEHGFPTFLIWLGIILAGIFYSMRILALARGRPELRWAADLARMAQVSTVAYVSAGTFLSLSYWDLFWTLMVVLGATHALVVAALRATQGAARERKAMAAAPAPQEAPALARDPPMRDRPAHDPLVRDPSMRAPLAREPAASGQAPPPATAQSADPRPGWRTRAATARP